MTAMWKQSALDQAQKKAVLRNLEKVVAEQKKTIQRLKLETADLKHQRDTMHASYNSVRDQKHDLEKFQERYEFLREQELMIMNKDGAQYLKGEDLDKYVDKKLQEMPINYWGNSMSSKYAQALAKSMMQTKEAIATRLLSQPAQTPVDGQYHYAWKAYPMSFTITEEPNDGDDPGSQS